MGITQNGIVWITKRGAAFSLCIVNFSIIADSEISLSWRKSKAYRKFEFLLCIVIFVIIAKIWHSEIFARATKFSLPLRNFRNPCENFAMP